MGHEEMEGGGQVKQRTVGEREDAEVGEGKGKRKGQERGGRRRIRREVKTKGFQGIQR